MLTKEISASEPKNKSAQTDAELSAYWTLPPEQLLQKLHSQPGGLSSADVENRLRQFGPNVLKRRRSATRLGLFLNQFKSPLVLILIFAASVSAFVREWVDAAIVLLIVVGSAALSFIQEYSATTAV